METLFKSRGKIEYMMGREGGVKRAGQPWVIVHVPNSIAEYYRAQIIRHLINPFNQDPNLGVNPVPDRIHPPKWGAHITVLDGRYDIPKDRMQFWNKHNRETVEFEYSPRIMQIWKFFVLPVTCPLLDDIRKELGLKPHPLHITVGRIE